MHEPAEEGLSDTRHQQILTSETPSASTTLISIGSKGNTSSHKRTYQNTETEVKCSTPVLFCTNRGLCLRLFKSPAASLASSNSARSRESQTRVTTDSKFNLYDLKFCDLERWSTNRANTIGLDDTIASRTFTVQKKNNLIPTKHSMVRFNTSYSVFEEQ